MNIYGNSSDLLRESKQNLNTKSLIQFIYENQKMLQRPIFYNGEKYIICRPPIRVLEFI